MNEKNEYDFYEKIKDWNFDEFEIKIEDFTDWDMYKILESVTNEDSCVLDLGTGGGEKVIKNFPIYLKEVIATDYSKSMIETAQKNLEESGRSNITFKVMNNLDLKLPENHFDVVVARHTVIDPKQIYEVLKKDGYLIVRGVDKYDCHSLKQVFGKGQSFDDSLPISIQDYEAILKAGFKDVELVPIHQREYFKDQETLYKFLLKVPIIEDFSEDSIDYYAKELDEEKLYNYVKKNSYQKGIRLLRRYYGITAKK